MTTSLWQLIILSLPFGELFRITIFDIVRIRLLDVLLVLVFAISYFKNEFEPTFAHPVWLLLGTLILSVAMNAFTITTPALYYLFRTILYLQLPIVFEQMKEEYKKKLIKTLKISFIILIVSGLIQYFVYPDLRNLFYAGYDPHLNRLFGPLLDPNLMGILLVWGTWFLFPHLSYLSGVFGLLLTFSRISWGIFIGGILIFFARQQYIGFLLGFLFIIGIFFIPKQFGEGNNILRVNSINAKVVSWSAGIKMFSARPLFGIGFNNLELMKGTQSNIPDNSLFGYDSSVLTILITSGIAGTCGYLLFMWYLFMKSENRFQKILVLSFFVHALSTNSFFTPTVFVYFILLYYL